MSIQEEQNRRQFSCTSVPLLPKENKTVKNAQMSKQETKGNENTTSNVYLTYDFAANLYSNKESILFYLFFHERKVEYKIL